MDESTARFYGRNACIPLLRMPGLERFGRACMVLGDDTYSNFNRSMRECLTNIDQNEIERTFPYSSEGICAAKHIEKYIKESGFLDDPYLLQNASSALMKKLTSQPSKQELCRRAATEWGSESGEFCNKYIPDFYPRIIYTDLEKCKRQCGPNRDCIVGCTIDQMRLNKVFNALEKIDELPMKLPPLSSSPRIQESFIYETNHANKRISFFLVLSLIILGVVVWIYQKK